MLARRRVQVVKLRRDEGHIVIIVLCFAGPIALTATENRSTTVLLCEELCQGEVMRCRISECQEWTHPVARVCKSEGRSDDDTTSHILSLTITVAQFPATLLQITVFSMQHD